MATHRNVGVHHPRARASIEARSATPLRRRGHLARRERRDQRGPCQHLAKAPARTGGAAGAAVRRPAHYSFQPAADARADGVAAAAALDARSPVAAVQHGTGARSSGHAGLRSAATGAAPAIRVIGTRRLSPGAGDLPELGDRTDGPDHARRLAEATADECAYRQADEPTRYGTGASNPSSKVSSAARMGSAPTFSGCSMPSMLSTTIPCTMDQQADAWPRTSRCLNSPLACPR